MCLQKETCYITADRAKCNVLENFVGRGCAGVLEV